MKDTNLLDAILPYPIIKYGNTGVRQCTAIALIPVLANRCTNSIVFDKSSNTRILHVTGKPHPSTLNQ